MDLPVSCAKLRGLRRLFLEGNLLRSVPECLLRLPRLEELGMGCNQLTGLPEGIGQLRSLLELWLVSNEISYLPQSIGELTRLRKLELSANSLHELPRCFGKLKGLTHLWMSGNSLSVFPQHLCALHHMRESGIGVDAGIPVEIHPRVRKRCQCPLGQAQLLQRLVSHHQNIGVANVDDASTQIRAGAPTDIRQMHTCRLVTNEQLDQPQLETALESPNRHGSQHGDVSQRFSCRSSLSSPLQGRQSGI